MARRDCRSRVDRIRGLPRQSDLVSAVESESVLREGLRGSCLRSPELLSTLGLVEQFGITNHNGKLDDESPARQQHEFDRWNRDLTQLHQYPLDRQSASQKLSTRVLGWFLQLQLEGEKWQWHNYPVNQLFGVQN